jgi:parvulin-like peptidyl-prolyl isomerase
MRAGPRWRWAAAALLLFCGCGRKKAPPAAPVPVVAVVDGTPIPVSALQRELDRARRGAGSQVVDGFPTPAKIEAKDLPRLARALLDPLIDRALLMQRAKVAGMTVSDAEVQSALDALAETARASGETFADRLAQDGQTLEQFAEDMRERLLAEKWVAEQTRGEKPSAAEVRAWFDQHRSDLDVKEEVHAQQILMPGQVSGVVQTSYGYHLFKVLGRRGPRPRKFEEVKDDVARRAFAEKQAQAERQLLEQVRKSAKIEIDEASFSLLR